MTETKRLIPDGVELKDAEDRTINEMRLRRMLGVEQRAAEEREKERPIEEKAKTWGYVREVHSIGNIQIAEVERKKEGKTLFCAFVNGKDTNEGAYSLDEALIIALCHKYDGYNTRAPEYIARMLGMPTKEG